MLIEQVLTNLGEKMSDEEVDELLKAVDTSSGEINYTGEEAPSVVISATIPILSTAICVHDRPCHAKT